MGKMCDVEGCNNLAVIQCRPVKVEVPIRGDVWKKFKPAGPVKAFCQIHENESVEYANSGVIR